MYKGIYFEKQVHTPDLNVVLERARENGIEKIIVTAGCLNDCNVTLEMVKNYDFLYTTVGVHPTRCGEFESNGTDPDQHIQRLMEMVEKGNVKIVAIGEFGLDYDRTQFCPIDIQKKIF